MSSSDWSSSIDMDLNEMNEEAAVRIVKTSNQGQFSKILQGASNHHHKDEKLSQLLKLDSLDQESRITTSYSPKASKSSLPKTPLNLKKINNKISDLFEDIKSPIPKIIDINERFYKFKEKVKAKIEKIAHDQEELEKKNCPFKPMLINNKRSTRNFGEFLQEMKTYEKCKDYKAKCLRNCVRKEKSLTTHTPALCKQSLQILTKKKELSQPVHDKLYNENKRKIEKRWK